MLIRLPLLFALLLSLAFGPVKLVAACAWPTSEVACGQCCAEPEMACCATASHSAPTKAPVSVAPTSVDLKQLVSPSLVLVGLSPLPAVERPSFYLRQAVRMPVSPRLELTCIRLI